MYLDSAYLAKYYVTEPDSARVRAAIESAETRVSSMWAIGEVVCAFHRHVREGHMTPEHCALLSELFLDHVASEVWVLTPVTERLLRKTASLIARAPAAVCLRTGDAVHLSTAQDLGEREIWSNDRHLLAAAPYFGLVGRSA